MYFLNNVGRCSVAQCYDNTWTMLAQSKDLYCQLVVALSDFVSHININVIRNIVKTVLAQLAIA